VYRAAKEKTEEDRFQTWYAFTCARTRLKTGSSQAQEGRPPIKDVANARAVHVMQVCADKLLGIAALLRQS